MRLNSHFQLLALAITIVLLPGCVQLTLAWADLTPDRPAASPPVLVAYDERPPIQTAEEWQEQQVPWLQEAFQEHVYGYFPEQSSAEIVARRIITENFLNGRARLEELTVRAIPDFGHSAPKEAIFTLLMAIPENIEGTVPVIVMETFCRNHHTIPYPDVSRPEGRSACDGGGVMNMAMTYVFGRYIATPPLEEVIEQGYALATFYPGDYVPDRVDDGFAALRGLSAGHKDDETRWGAIAAWAWGISRVIDVLEQDLRFDQDRMVAYGHSRYGKAALLAAAFDKRIDGVIAHQSGAGGASLSRNKLGETVKNITDTYPHWFSRKYAGYAGKEQSLPVDQHQLLALIAPRPIMLGNARRDVWSDPEGSFVAAQGAVPVYNLYEKTGLAKPDLRDFVPEASIAFQLRPGTHGVTEEDWPAFLDFLNAHF